MMGANSVKLPDVDRFEGGRRLLTQEELLALQTNLILFRVRRTLP